MTSPQELSKQIQLGNRRALAKAITLIESNRESDEQLAQELLSQLPENNQSIRIGISGVPGVGKSTFIEALGNHIIAQGKKVSVLAVDPSSPTTGGSILGDKTRMETLASREEAFIRPSPTSGTLGGVAKRTRETISLCEAAGYDVILVETVGVGQSEYEVASMVDCFMVLMLPGAGDSLQGIKRGILEITDMLVINKADGDQKKLAERAKNEYENAFHLIHPKYSGIQVQILACSAIEKNGIDEVWKASLHFMDLLKKSGVFSKNRIQQKLSWFKRLAEDEIIHLLWNQKDNKSFISSLENEVKNQSITPVQAANELVIQFKKQLRSQV
ncbi:methylmalonyl Co-A mutase-associated GTPase MeaB [bacterium]|nr:MAG: methylmalonyl Co-A mutase-associated GTPase MeaB [bacterium]